ncbi:class I SAM-dependent RNA methyltransferase, partial [Kocuria palustris]|nr:class I SAM-dependent RNA methyltransferase [Kocuria palustris]
PELVRIPQRRRRGGRPSRGRRGAASSVPSRRPDVVVLDPPRAGAGKVVVDAIAAIEPRRIVSVSCDPATAARDLARFRHRGWQVSSLRGLDLYPNTHHLETVTVLERS